MIWRPWPRIICWWWEHHVLLKCSRNVPPGVFSKDDLYVSRRWRQIQYMVDLFWHRWTQEYLPLLQERQKWSTTRRNFNVGDVVLIVDSSAPRNSWLIGKIVKTMPDTQGTVRSVCVQTKTSTLERPITKICLLEEASWRSQKHCTIQWVQKLKKFIYHSLLYRRQWLYVLCFVIDMQSPYSIRGRLC